MKSKPIFKHEAFKKHLFQLKPPPVPTSKWSVEDWIEYIDSCDGWTVPVHDIDSTTQR